MTDEPLNARELGMRSRAAVHAGDRDGWLALFADDALVQDPIGPSPFDPEGKGHRGIDAIAAFYDTVIAPSAGRDHRVVEGGDGVDAAVALALGIERRGADRVLHEGVGGKQRQPAVAVAVVDGGPGAHPELTGVEWFVGHVVSLPLSGPCR